MPKKRDTTSPRYHAKGILDRLLARPEATDENGEYDPIKDEIKMIEIIERYIAKNIKP